MIKTPVDIEGRFREMILARSPGDRLTMACRMFTTAKALVRSGLLEEYGHIERGELRRHIFLRFYSSDFSKAEREKITEIMKAT